jgi:hypothetical protein
VTPRAGLPLALTLAACASTDLEHEVRRARLERDQALVEAQRARIEADRALLEAEKLRMEAERALARPCAEPAPPVAPATTIVQGTFDFAGKPTVVEMHVAGMGIDESFRSDKKGKIAIELPVGTYQLRLHAEGYREKVVTLDVTAPPPGEDRFRFAERLER